MSVSRGLELDRLPRLKHLPPFDESCGGIGAIRCNASFFTSSSSESAIFPSSSLDISNGTKIHSLVFAVAALFIAFSGSKQKRWLFAITSIRLKKRLNSLIRACLY